MMEREGALNAFANILQTFLCPSEKERKVIRVEKGQTGIFSYHIICQVTFVLQCSISMINYFWGETTRKSQKVTPAMGGSIK